MEEMARLFSEGMDINLGTFTSLKGYSFFQRPCHWLLPFDTMRPEFPGINTICNVPICDSDKYSVCLLIKHIPQSQREDMIRLLEGHAEVLAMQAEESRDDFQNVIQCLYRLLRRSPWRTQWSDIFTKSAMLLTSGLLGAQLRHSQEFLQSTAKTLLRHHHYEMAELHLRAIAELTGTDYSVLMNLALCAQEQGKFRQASNYYQQASMLNSNDKNILYRLQYCYAQQQRYSDQLDCLLQLEKIVPDNTKIQTEIGLCLIQLESWEDAQKRFYKLEFSGVNHQANLRAIAWCALKMNDLQEAQKYYTRIIEESTHATWEDYLNAGHVAWLQGDIRSAINLYTEYVRRYATARPNSTDIMQPFVQDGDILRKGGISDSDINIMYDLIAWQPTNK
jgi:tetratricopeptide (TPR) repeat protein